MKAKLLLTLLALSAVTGCDFYPSPPRAHVVKTMANLKVLHEAVDLFHMDVGRYPTQQEGLSALITKPANAKEWCEGGYLERAVLPKDGWNRDFHYVANPSENVPFTIISFGEDGRKGGRGDNADLSSAELNNDKK